jgi:hypothetical protein
MDRIFGSYFDGGSLEEMQIDTLWYIDKCAYVSAIRRTVKVEVCNVFGRALSLLHLPILSQQV